MKVLFFTNIPAPYRIDFFNEFGKYVELTVIFEAKKSSDRDTFFHWKNNNEYHFKKIFLQEKLNNRRPSFNVLKYLNAEYDAIILTNYYSSLTGMIAFLYCLLKRIKFIAEFDGTMLHKESKIKYFIKRFFISQASAFFSSSNMTDQYIHYYGGRYENIYRYHFTSTMNKDILSCRQLLQCRNTIRNKWNITEKKVILYVGQFIHRKGIDVLLNAIPYLNKGQWVILMVGGEPLPEYIELLRNVNKNRQCDVHFISSVNKEKLKEYYACADVFVLPTREDIWGLVINEAMSYALPVITTDKCIAGLEMIKNGENGFIIPSENSKILAEKIEYLGKNVADRMKMGANNKKKIADYTIEEMVLDHVKTLNYIKSKKNS